MTKPMLIAASALCLLAMPAHAESACEAETQQLWRAVDLSDLDRATKQQVGTILLHAQQQAVAGEEHLCQQTVDEVKVALGVGASDGAVQGPDG